MLRLCLLLIPIFCLAQDQTKEIPLVRFEDKVLTLESFDDEELNQYLRQIHARVSTILMERVAKESGLKDLHEHQKEHMLEDAINDGQVGFLFEKPLIPVPTKGAYIAKHEDAPVMIMEFIDSQCGFCKEAHPLMQRLKRRYGSKIAWAIRHYPLPGHEAAIPAANALECAREGGKFDELHNALMAFPQKQSMDDLLRYGAQVGLDMESYKTCLESKRHAAKVKSDQELAQKIGIDATPSFIIGRHDKEKGILTGELVIGLLHYGDYEKLVKKYLKP